MPDRPHRSLSMWVNLRDDETGREVPLTIRLALWRGRRFLFVGWVGSGMTPIVMDEQDKRVCSTYDFFSVVSSSAFPDDIPAHLSRGAD